MKRVVVVCLALYAGVLLGAQTQPAVPATSGEAAAILSAARQALGGEASLASVKTIATTGRTQQVQGDNLVPIEFEILIEFPDKYVRTDEIPARGSGPSRRGFNADALIQVGDQPGGGRGRGGPPPAGAPGRGDGSSPNPTLPIKQDFARLTLGMFATSFSTYPQTF
jgi:hypothetical protein